MGNIFLAYYPSFGKCASWWDNILGYIDAYHPAFDTKLQKLIGQYGATHSEYGLFFHNHDDAAQFLLQWG